MDIKTITSTQNKLVKLVRSLTKKKFRDEYGLMLLEGGNLLKDLPESVKPKYAFAVEERKDELMRLDAEEAYLVSDAVMQSLTDTVTPYGLAAVCGICKREFAPPKGNALLLDGVADPGNLGTIFRTAVACGFEDVYTLSCADAFSPKTVRASLGGALKLRIYEVDANKALELATSLNSCALDMDGQNIFGFSKQDDVLLIAGNEARGISEELRQAAKHTLSLPMKNGMESLNVAVATAVAMYMMIGEKI